MVCVKYVRHVHMYVCMYVCMHVCDVMYVYKCMYVSYVFKCKNEAFSLKSGA